MILAFDGHNRALSIPEIVAKAGLNRAVIRQLVRTLEQLGFVSADRGRYELTPRVLRLAQGFMQTRSIPQLVQPLLRSASHEIGESVSFAMLDDDEAIYVAHAFVPSRYSLNMVTVGSRVPLAPTAIGRAMLAFLPRQGEARPDPRPDRFHALHPAHADRPQALIDLLNVIRISGFCYAEAEYVEGVGAVSIIFPQGQYGESDINGRLTPLLGRFAADIGAAL